jgi:hypothetical protein
MDLPLYRSGVLEVLGMQRLTRLDRLSDLRAHMVRFDQVASLMSELKVVCGASSTSTTRNNVIQRCLAPAGALMQVDRLLAQLADTLVALKDGQTSTLLAQTLLVAQVSALTLR